MRLRWISAFLLVLACGGRLAGRTSAADAVLLDDDFSRYPPGLLSAPIGQLNPAIQEYHYLAHRGVPLAPWENAIGYLDAWAAGDEDERPYLEQHLSPDHRWMEPKLFAPSFITGYPEWTDYTAEVSLRPLSLAGMAGLVFRYQTNRHHVVFVLEDGKRADLRRACRWRRNSAWPPGAKFPPRRSNTTPPATTG